MKNVVRILFVLLAAVALGKSVSAQALQKIVIADTPTTHHLNLYVAKEKGIFAKHGLDVQINEVQSAAAQRDLVLSRRADGFWACPTAVMGAIGNGAPVVFVAQVKRPCTSVLMVPKNSDIRTFKDLDGKTIGGLGPGCCAVIYIQKLAERVGARFNLVNMAGGPAIAALEAGQVAGIIVEEPHASIAELRGYKTLFRNEMKDSVCRTVQFHRDFVKANPQAVINLVAALDEANALINANPKAADIVDIAVKYTRTPKEAILHGNDRLRFTTKLDEEKHKELAAFLVKIGIIRRNIVPESFAPEMKGITW